MRMTVETRREFLRDHLSLVYPKRSWPKTVPAKVIDGAELAAFIADAPVVTDQTAVPSPPPARSIFQVKPGADR